MIKITNYDDFKEYNGASEGSGRSEKIWLINPETGKSGLFKFPKNDTEGNITTEHISEHMAYRIARRLKLDYVRYDIGIRENRIGCYCESFLKSDSETILHGIDFITLAYPQYDPDKLYDRKTGMFYCIDMIFNSFEMAYKDEKEAIYYLKSKIILMMLFDMFIGNTDRHHNNWGIIVNYNDDSARFAPLYDNGSSLCAYINGSNVRKYLGKDEQLFYSLVDSKSKSRIRVNGKSKKEPTHKEVLKHLKDTYEPFLSGIELFNNKISEGFISMLLNEYPDEILSKDKKELIYKFLLKKLAIIKEFI